jgi:molecular chaperone DnaK (HSP70)
VKEIFLLDVTPLTRGVEVITGLLDPIIVRNTSIPIKIPKTYTTPEDNLTSLWINIYEGERPLAKDNHFLGELVIKGLPPKPKGEV